jgi:hypothetical protein
MESNNLKQMLKLKIKRVKPLKRKVHKLKLKINQKTIIF